MIRILTALFLLLLITGFQNCAKKSGPAMVFVGTTPLSATAVIQGSGYGSYSAPAGSASLSSLMMASSVVQFSLSENKMTQTFYEPTPSARSCDLGANADFLALKSMMLAQSICTYRSNVTEEQLAEHGFRCPLFQTSQSPSDDFYFSALTSGETSSLGASLSANLATVRSLDPYCVSEISIFCNEPDTAPMINKAKTLVDQFATFATCADTPVN